jgi:hypothetical protein
MKRPILRLAVRASRESDIAHAFFVQSLMIINSSFISRIPILEKSNTQVSNNIVLEISNVEGTIDTTSNVLIACMKFVFTQS